MRHTSHPDYNPERSMGADFVCLPYDVAGYVNVSQLGDIVAAVEANDWARVCFLCGVSEEDESKFPKKG